MILKEFFKKNMVWTIIGGIVLFGGITGVVAAAVSASDITYTNNGQSTVQSAIDDLYTKASKWLNPNDMETPKYYATTGTYKGWCGSTDASCNSYTDFPTTATTPPSGKNVYAAQYEDGQYGVCIQRNGKEHCFRGRNYKAEAKHVQEVFSDISCYVGSDSVYCYSDFYCGVNSNGYVGCGDHGSTPKDCLVSTNGSIRCS